MAVPSTPGSLTWENPMISWLLGNRWEEAFFLALKNDYLKSFSYLTFNVPIPGKAQKKCLRPSLLEWLQRSSTIQQPAWNNTVVKEGSDESTFSLWNIHILKVKSHSASTLEARMLEKKAHFHPNNKKRSQINYKTITHLKPHTSKHEEIT